MILFIAEKPMLAKAIAAAMPGSQTFDKDTGTYRKQFEGEEAVIFACLGHLLTLAKPEEYDEKYAKWCLEDLPIYFENWKKSLPADPEKQDRVKKLVALTKQADKIVVAGDMDDEGQLLCDELVEWSGYKGPQYRLNTLDTAPSALFKALHHMENNEDHIQNGKVAAGREISDMVFGFNLSRYYTLINEAKIPLSVGRVQTPTLGLVVRRDMEINSHQKVFYYTLEVELDVNGKKVVAKYIPPKDDPALDDEGHIRDKKVLESVADTIKGKTFSAVVEKKTAQESPPLPFNFNRLCTYCSSKWDYSPAKTLKITQSLRDDHNAITYNRTDCSYLTEEYFKQAPKTVPMISDNLHLNADSFDTTIHSKCFNDEEVAKSSHFAMIPTQTTQDISSFKVEEQNVYQAIARYYLAQFMPPTKKEKTRIVISLPNGGNLVGVSTEILDKGYRAIIHPESEIETGENDGDKENDDARSALSDIPAGSYTATASGEPTISSRETKPPSHYTEASLQDDMTRVSRYVENETIKKLLLEKDKGKKGENGSIGTSATRPAIIQTLIKRGYISSFKKGKLTYLQATELGIDFYNSLPDSIRKVDVTAKWYVIQEDIRIGKTTPEAMARDVLRSVTKIVQSGEGRMANADKLGAGLMGDPVGKCPKCGKNIFMSQRSYRCEGCGYSIWYNNGLLAAIGKSLRPNIMTSLLKNGKASLSGCVSKKTGKKFNAILKADFSGEKMELALDFGPSNENSLGKCPKCGQGEMMEYPSNFKCNNESCDFVMFKDDGFLKSMGKKLTAPMVKDLLANRKTKIKGCKSKKTGKEYSCTLILKDDFSGKYPSWEREF